MKRSLLLAVLCLSIGCVVGLPQQGHMPGLILSDLHLISQESLSHWTSAWSGPIQIATIVAWFAEHGYPALHHDQDFSVAGVLGTFPLTSTLDFDPVIPTFSWYPTADISIAGVELGLDLTLADLFGRVMKGSRSEIRSSDVRLAVTLAEYVASIYPDMFALELYDSGFQEEFATEYSRPFASDIVEGIELRLKSDPTLLAYEQSLASGRGVIVGLEEQEGANTYLSGRSFLYPELPGEFTPVGFAWAKEDRLQPGHQGTALDTVGMMDEGFYVDLLDWAPLSSCLSLSHYARPSQMRRNTPAPRMRCASQRLLPLNMETSRFSHLSYVKEL